MIAEVTTAALMSENKHLATPCSTDSTPTSANQEDHVSMAAHGARRLTPMVANLEHILGIEALCAAQGIEFRAPLADQRAARGGAARGSAPRCRRSARTATSRPTSRPPRRWSATARSLAASGAGLPGARGMTPVEVGEGDGPVVLGLPHTGTLAAGGRLRRG